jgi:pilus assembly protein CpaE
VPFTQIVILSVQGDPNYMRRAMLAGARDFLTKPPIVDELISAIRRSGMMAHDDRKKASVQYSAQTSAAGTGGLSGAAGAMGSVVLVYSPKGGTGCTTIATNLAVTLHNEETPVVLVDANLQFGNVAVMLNERGKNSVVDLSSRADELDNDVVDNVLLKHATSGIRILAAPSRPEYAENVTGEQFSKILKFLRRMYSYVVIDTSSTLTDPVLNALDEADIIVLVVTQDIPSINNARLFLDLADVLGPERKNVIFTMNRYDKRIAITSERVGENLKKDVEAILPLDERVVVPSVNRGVPFIISMKSRPISRAILDLAELIRQRLAVLESGHGLE